MYSEATKNFAAEQEEIVSCLEFRVFDEGSNERSEGRDECMRDYARVLYSSSFRRLQGKMQLFGLDSSRFHRNRLTHSLEVAQIARSIAYDLGLKNTVVAETCSLMHDIGNPPFGHSGEIVLNELCENIEGFEGNAQAFRVFRLLEKKHPSYSGLNLTLRTIFGVTKYFNKKVDNQDKFLYNDDYFFLQEQLDKKGIKIKKSIDAQIMDLSDEIAYAAHDLEDALSFGLVSLGEIVHEFKISEKYSGAYDSFLGIVNQCQKIALESNTQNTSEEYSAVLRKELTSTIVNRLCRDISVIENNCGDRELGYAEHDKLACGLKKLLFKAILRKKDIQLYEKQGEKIIRGLFAVYSDTKFNSNNVLLPPELRKIKAPQNRLVADHISGMMDLFAHKEYERYFGPGSLSALYPTA